MKPPPDPICDHTPDPLREQPPADQFCDVVLNGGVASGVVYPWALLKLARHYRFRSIGGNSVGAMAAAMTAAAEYGRCNGVEDAFEPLRRMPLKLAAEEGGETKLLRMFQPSAPVSRLFDVFLAAVSWSDPALGKPKRGAQALLGSALRIYQVWMPLLPLLLLTFWATRHVQGALATGLVWVLGLLSAVLLALLFVAWQVYRDLRALERNGYGLVKGCGQGGEEGLVEWLHKGIQLSAGRGRDEPPLTFADLWGAPRFGCAGPLPLAGGLQPPDPGIELQMFTSNVTQGRPVRLPLNDANTRLYYDPEEWKSLFPAYVMKALNEASSPYRPASSSDPDPSRHNLDAGQLQRVATLRELPGGAMPIVVAARLSLCFPVLFSCVPVYAVDYERREGQRRLGRCLLSDGGLHTNFPIHLFDCAHPRWPTFALMLERRLTDFKAQARWLPKTHQEGRADNWQRFVPGADDNDERPLLRRLGGLVGGLVLTMKDWNDRVTVRLPQVRNRVIRLALKEGEGQLNLAMPGTTILRMAHEYGTLAGEELVKTFAPDENGIKPAWREHLYVRAMVELRALSQHLSGYTQAVHLQGSTQPLGDVLDAAARNRPLAQRSGRPDPAGAALTAAQRQALERAVQAVQALEGELSACAGALGPYRPVPEPELRLRPPL